MYIVAMRMQTGPKQDEDHPFVASCYYCCPIFQLFLLVSFSSFIFLSPVHGTNSLSLSHTHTLSLRGPFSFLFAHLATSSSSSSSTSSFDPYYRHLGKSRLKFCSETRKRSSSSSRNRKKAGWKKTTHWLTHASY